PESGNITSIERAGPYYIKTTDGVNWTRPALVSGNIGGKLCGGNHSPIRLDSGRIMWAGFNAVAYTDDSTMKTGWIGRSFSLASGETKTNSMTESTVYQHANGTLFLFSRTDGGTIIVAASTDDGKTWTDSYHTKIQDYGAKFQFGRLPDGRYYYLGNMDNKRSNITLIVSDDGINFDQWYVLKDDEYTQMESGMYKAGLYGYPTSYFDENYMYVVYSLRKESVEVLRVPLSSISVK
ncbi:MAG: exo-alpha-sialidase, partial [Clostridia bacterium]|nr:exo-alpha-sialidase [Clostridia bacterium]